MEITYSGRINKIPGYLFADIDRQIAEKKASGVDVISLGIGDPDLPTPKNIIDAPRVSDFHIIFSFLQK